MQALDNDFADYMHIFTRAFTKLSTTRTIQHSGHRLIKDYKEATAEKQVTPELLDLKER